jgi:terminase small subunit-like protein
MSMAGKTSKASTPQRAKGGRPGKFSQNMADAICEQIVQGKSVRQICQQQGMSAERTVYYWLEKDREFCQQYARARGAGRLYFDQCIAIANDRTGDYVTAYTEDGKTFERVNHEHIQRSRLRVDTLKWAASKLAPKKYADQFAFSGPDGSPVGVQPAVIITIGPQAASAREWRVQRDRRISPS